MTAAGGARAPLPDLADAVAANALIEDVTAAAMLTYADAPGASHRQDHDLLWIRSGEPFASRNHVFKLRMREVGFRERVVAVCAAFLPDSLPVTWWVGPHSEPRDVGRRLRELGLQEEELEFGMVRDLAEPLPPGELPPGAVIGRVREGRDLEDWLALQSAAYDWPADGSKRSYYRRLYLRDFEHATETRHHFLLRERGEPVAGASLLIAAGHAFVTNVATAPAARGRGFGTAATVATLQTARRLGYHAAVLTASVDGRGLYLRLGFREFGALERYTADAAMLGDRRRG